MKRFALFLSIALFGVFAAKADDSQPIQLVRIQGLAEQVVGEKVLYKIYQQAGIPVQITAMPGKRAHFETAFDGKDGEMLRIWSYGKTNPTLHRISVPIGEIRTQAFAHKDFRFDVHSKADYDYVVVRGVQHTQDATTTYDNVVELNSPIAMFSFVAFKRADIALSSYLDGMYHLREQNITSVVPIGVPWEVHPLFHYLHDKHKEIIPKLTETIALMKASGELDQLWNQAVEELLSGKLPGDK